MSHLLQFMPPVHPSVRRDLFELSRYLCELCLCDSFFVEYRPSSIAYAAILNVFDHMTKARISTGIRKSFIENLSELLKLKHNDPNIAAARSRMQAMFSSSMERYALDGMALSSSDATISASTSDMKNPSYDSVSASASASAAKQSQASQHECSGSIGSHSDNSNRQPRRPSRVQ